MIARENLYDVPKEATAFLNPFNKVPPPETPFDDLTVDIIKWGLAQGVKEKEIIIVARIIQKYELFFWDTLERSAESLQALDRPAESLQTSALYSFLYGLAAGQMPPGHINSKT